MGFFRFSELSNLKCSDFILHITHVLIFIENSKTGIYRKRHWLHLGKLSPNLCPFEITKRYFVLAGIDKQCDKYILEELKTPKTARTSSQYRFRSQEIRTS